MSNLKPCPFCGGEAFAKSIYPHDSFGRQSDTPYWSVECHEWDICGASVTGHMTKDEAFTAWNRRAPRVGGGTGKGGADNGQ